MKNSEFPLSKSLGPSLPAVCSLVVLILSFLPKGVKFRWFNPEREVVTYGAILGDITLGYQPWLVLAVILLSITLCSWIYCALLNQKPRAWLMLVLSACGVGLLAVTLCTGIDVTWILWTVFALSLVQTVSWLVLILRNRK